MQLPPKLHIGYRDYDIQEIDPADVGQSVGMHYPQRQIIQLDSTIKPNEVVNTLIHEVLHAIISVAHFEFEDETHEEATVTCLGNGLTQFFRDNGKVIQWMVDNCQTTNEKTSKVH